ncbi:MAG: hypothetical protein ACRC7C_10525 [Beijerinckiaceae bacterium]
MSSALIGAVAGATLGLVAALIFGRFMTAIEENAVIGLDRDKAMEKREMYGTLRKAVLVIDVVMFAVVGYFVAPMFIG